mmetsp:Transcript_7617/g.17519  ORF Transcript_7617/g.17519 Transcript_7617/m.17519 type:complete len:248 (+) Transcript_7617:959-1702(+)
MGGQRSDNVFTRNDHVRFSSNRRAVRQPAGGAAHCLDHKITLGTHCIRAQILELLGNGSDSSEKAKSEVDAGIVIVNSLWDVDDAHALGVRRQALLVLVHVVRGPESAITANRNNCVQLEFHQRVIHILEVPSLRGIVEVGRRFDAAAGSSARGANNNPTAVPEAPQVSALENHIVLAFHKRPRVFDQGGVAVHDPDHLDAKPAQRAGRDRDDRVCTRRRTTCKHNPDTLDLGALFHGQRLGCCTPT